MLKKREKLILYITITVVFLSVVFNFIVFPLAAKYGTLNREINFNKTKLRKYLQLLNQKQEIENKYGRFFSNQGSFSDSKNNLVAAMATLETLAKNANIKIIDIRPQTISKGDKVIIELRTEGQIEAYTKFIYDTEASLSLFKIVRLQLAAKANKTALEGAFTITQPVISK